MTTTAVHERPAIEEMYVVHRVFRREFRMLPGLVRGVQEGDTDNTAGSERPQPRNPDGPATQAQWGLIRKLLTEIGIEGDEAQDDALCKAGFAPDGLTVSQASEAINRLLAKKNGQQ